MLLFPLGREPLIALCTLGVGVVCAPGYGPGVVLVGGSLVGVVAAVGGGVGFQPEIVLRCGGFFRVE